LDRGTGRSLVYRSHPLGAKSPAIARVLVIIHETERDARSAYGIALAAAARVRALNDTLIIAPRFSSNDGDVCRDHLAPREVNWPCLGDSWRSGGLAVGSAVSSFDLLDEILRRVSMREVFPNLKSIVVAGHSAGGQFVTRYAMASRVNG